MNIGKEFVSVFITGEDQEPPALLCALRITRTGGRFPLELDATGNVSIPGLLIETTGWEKDDKLTLVFSKPVDGLSVKNCIGTEGAPGLVMESTPGYKTEIVFRFESKPVYESRFVFRLKPGVKDSAGNESEDEYVYRVFANGGASKPPMLAGIRMPMAPGSDNEKELVYYGTDSLFSTIPITEGRDNYPSGESIKTWMELYFNTAENASIDLFSLMELFRIETSNNVLTFSPRQIKTDNFSVTAPQTGWEDMERIEIIGTLVNSTNYGIVNIQIMPGLKDSLDNVNDKLLRISLVK
jgi:hypothetical protein